MNTLRFALAVGLAFSLGCGGRERPNLILLTIDTCRADRLSCYGYDRETTPNLDRLASEGVLFENTRTCVPITLPSHVSILTGLYPTFHGVHENGFYTAADSLLTLAEILKGEGYATAAFVGAFPLDSRFNLDQGFDHYGDAFGEREGRSVPGVGGVSIFFVERPANEVNEEFFHWLKERGREPFFVWIHYFDPHQPFEPRPPYDAMYAGSPYSAEIAFVDECVGRLRGRLEQTGHMERTIFAVTSDHGEALGQHGEISHALLLFDSTLRVPWIMRCPQDMRIAGRFSHPVRTVDILPTLLELLGFEIPGMLHGTSMAGLFRGEDGGVRDHYYETFFGKLHFGWSVLLGYQSGPWKYVHGPKPELYQTALDPAEMSNVIEVYPDTAAQLTEKLFSLVSEAPEEGHSMFTDTDQETQARLEALGYVGSFEEAGPRPAWFEGANPMEMMDAHQSYNTGRGFVHAGQWIEAAEAFRHALETNEQNKDARIGLVDALLRGGDLPAALKEAKDAVTMYPHEGRLWRLYAGLLLQQRRFDDALHASRQALANGADPIEAWILIGRCIEALGDFPEAVAAFRRVLEIDPTVFQARVRLATCLAMLARTKEAENQFHLALEDNPYYAPAHYNFGVFVLQKERVNEAIAAFEKAVQFSPAYAEAHHALAILYNNDGQAQAAQPHLEAVIRYADDPKRREAARMLLEEISGS